MSDDRPPRVFISYSHDDRQHSNRVAALSARLRRDGVDCRIDQHCVFPHEGWPAWTRRQIDEAQTVLVVCTETYRQRFEQKQSPRIGRGVRWESLLIQAHIYQAGSINQKFLPVVFDPADERQIPTVLSSFQFACVDPDDLDGDGYRKLLETMGVKPTDPLEPLPVQEDFFRPEVPTGDPDELLVQIHALPVTGPELFGRDEPLQWLDRAWADQHTNAISLVAFGGVGKSALVNHWLAKLALEDYRGARRVYGWSAYSQGSKQRAAAADLFIDRALRFFDDPDPEAGPIDQRAVRLAELIRHQKTLLVLDGIESLQYAPGEAGGHIKDLGLRTLVRELAARNPGLCVITTRQQVADLAAYETTTAPKIELEKLEPPDGAKLLEFLGVKGTPEELQEASKEFGGHALALTLLGTWLRDAYAGDVRKWREIGPLEHELTEGGHARRVMDSYEEWLGDGPERAVLRMLGLFDRPAEPGAVRALRKDPPIDGLTDKLDDWTNALIRLRHARLVAAAEAADPDTLDAHPWVREHFGVKLQAENPEAWRAGHDRLFDYYRTDGCQKELPDTLDEMAPLFAAVIHGCAAGRHQEALDEVFWSRIRRQDEAYSWRKLGAFGSELAALSGFFDAPWAAPVERISDPDKGFVLNAAGFHLRALGRLAEAAEPMKAALQAVVDLKDWNNAARYSGNLSELQVTLGRIAESIESAEQTVDYADRSGDAFMRTVGRTQQADALHQAGRLDEADDLLRRAEQMQKDDEPEYPLLYSLRGYLYCDLLLTRGRYEDVLDRAAQTLEWDAPFGRILDIGLHNLSLAWAGLMAAQSGRADAVEQARTHIHEAVDTLRKAGQQQFLPPGLLGRAEFYRYVGERAAARADLDEAMAIATRDPAGQMKLFITDIHLLAARLDLDEGRRPEAQEHLTEARALIQQTGYHRRDGELAELEGK